MLTLRELRNLITIAECPKRVPTPKQLKESGIEVIAKEMIDKETWICVYANGLVQYRVGKRYTVFSIIACGAYEYESVNNESKVYRASFFEDERWYIRLIMEGEDRMAETQEKRKLRNKVFSYEQIINDFGDIADPSEDILEVLIKKDLAMELLEQLTERLLWSSIFVTLMANKIGGLQFGIYRNCQISSRVFHTAVAALPLTKATRSDFE